MHCGAKTSHTKKRGKIRRCDWCSERIEAGERYQKWLYFDGGQRSTVYAHDECGEAWQRAATDEGGILESCGGNLRPKPTLSSNKED